MKDCLLKLFQTSAFFLCLTCSVFAQDAEQRLLGMEVMDKITQKAPSLKAFLNSPQLQEEYYAAAKEYYSGRLARNSFDEITRQLKILVKEVPELDDRLWKPQQSDPQLLKPYAIEGSVKSSGRSLNETQLNAGIAKVEKENKILSRSVARLNSSARNELIQKISEDLSQKIKTFNETMPTDLNPKALGEYKSKFFSQIKNDPKLNKFGSFYANELMKSETFQDVIRTGDADLIIDLINHQLQGKTKSFLVNVPEAVHPEVIKAVQNHLPKFSGEAFETIFPKIMVRSTQGRMFPIGAGAATYEVKAFPRLFHRAMSGAILGECIGGCTSSPEHADPLRYLAPAGDPASVAYYTENRGAYSGFIDIIPGKVDGMSKKVVSMGIGDPHFSKNLALKVDGNSKSTPIWSEFHRQISERMPSDWGGVVISNLGGADNAHVLPSVRESDHYAFGDSIQGKFKMDDPLIGRLQNAAKKAARNVNYVKGHVMILDATLNDASLTLLVDPRDPKNILSRAEAVVENGTGAKLERSIAILLEEETKHLRLSKEWLEKANAWNGSNDLRLKKAISKYETLYLNTHYPDLMSEETIKKLFSPSQADHLAYLKFLEKNPSALSLDKRNAIIRILENGEVHTSQPATEFYSRLKGYPFLSKYLESISPAERVRVITHPETQLDLFKRRNFFQHPVFLAQNEKDLLRKVLLNPADSDRTTYFHTLARDQGKKGLEVITHDYELTYAILSDPKNPMYEKTLNSVKEKVSQLRDQPHNASIVFVEKAVLANPQLADDLGDTLNKEVGRLSQKPGFTHELFDRVVSEPMHPLRRAFIIESNSSNTYLIKPEKVMEYLSRPNEPNRRELVELVFGRARNIETVGRLIADPQHLAHQTAKDFAHRMMKDLQLTKVEWLKHGHWDQVIKEDLDQVINQVKGKSIEVKTRAINEQFIDYYFKGRSLGESNGIGQLAIAELDRLAIKDPALAKALMPHASEVMTTETRWEKSILKGYGKSEVLKAVRNYEKMGPFEQLHVRQSLFNILIDDRLNHMPKEAVFQFALQAHEYEFAEQVSPYVKEWGRKNFRRPVTLMGRGMTCINQVLYRVLGVPTKP